MTESTRFALKTIKRFTWKASIPLARESIFSVSHEYFSKLCLKVCMLVEFWLSFFLFIFFISNAFLSSPLPNLADPRLSGAGWKWKLLIHQSTFFTRVTSGVMETAHPLSRASVETAESRAPLTFRRRNKNVTGATHLRCNSVGRTGPSSAGVLGCNGGSGLPPGRRHSGPDRARTASFWSGRSPADRRPDTHPGRGTWAPQTYLHTERERDPGWEKMALRWHTSRIQIHTLSFLFFFFLITAWFGFLGA